MKDNVEVDKDAFAEKAFQMHSAVLIEFTFNSNFNLYEVARISRVVSFIKAGATKQLEQVEESITVSGIMLYPESVEYLFHLEGLIKKLFYFLLFYNVIPRTNLFLFNAQVIADFNHYCQGTGSRTFSRQNIKQSIRKLADGNIIQNVKRGTYMLNPLLAGGASEYGRRSLIQDYSFLLVKKKKDPVYDFYPKYNLK